MRKVWHYGRRRFVAWALAWVCLLLWQAPPAAAFWGRGEKGEGRAKGTQTPDAKQRRLIETKAREAERNRPDVVELSEAEMRLIRGRGPYRNEYFSGVLPWQRSLRDVNLCNGNLFKSFTDIQVSPARGAGLAFQRSYNSNDARVGAFGVGWTFSYDLRMEEADPNGVENDGDTIGPDKAVRTDFFGGKHTYKRDADGLYSPPPYLFDELDSTYLQFLADGPPPVLQGVSKVR